MKYVNATTKCFKSMTTKENRVVSYDVPFSGIRHSEDGDNISVNDFLIITNIDFLGTANDSHKKENPLENHRIIDFIIRLTKCSNDEEKRIGYDLDSFSINLQEMYESKQYNTACFDFLNYTRTTKIETLELPGGIGKYVIKVLIKDSKDDEYTIQTMSQLTVM